MPVDLSILNKSSEDEKLTDSLLYCLDGNVPSDLTLSISNLAVDRRSPLKVISNIDKIVNIDKSPNRKRCASTSGSSISDVKKIMVQKENEFVIRETEL